MPKFTFEQLLDMDLWARGKALNSMSADERKQIVIPDIDPTAANKIIPQ